MINAASQDFAQRTGPESAHRFLIGATWALILVSFLTFSWWILGRPLTESTPWLLDALLVAVLMSLAAAGDARTFLVEWHYSIPASFGGVLSLFLVGRSWSDLQTSVLVLFGVLVLAATASLLFGALGFGDVMMMIALGTLTAPLGPLALYCAVSVACVLAITFIIVAMVFGAQVAVSLDEGEEPVFRPGTALGPFIVIGFFTAPFLTPLASAYLGGVL